MKTNSTTQETSTLHSFLSSTTNSLSTVSWGAVRVSEILYLGPKLLELARKIEKLGENHRQLTHKLSDTATQEEAAKLKLQSIGYSAATLALRVAAGLVFADAVAGWTHSYFTASPENESPSPTPPSPPEDLPAPNQCCTRAEECQQELSDLRSSNDICSQELTRCRTQPNSRERTFDPCATSLNECIDELTDCHSTTDIRFGECMDTQSQLQSRVETLEKENESLRLKNKNLTNRNGELESNNREIQSNHDKIKTEHHRCLEDKQSLEDQASRNREELQQCKNLHQNYYSELDWLENDNNNCIDELKRVSDRLQTCEEREWEQAQKNPETRLTDREKGMRKECGYLLSKLSTSRLTTKRCQESSAKRAKELNWIKGTHPVQVIYKGKTLEIQASNLFEQCLREAEQFIKFSKGSLVSGSSLAKGEAVLNSCLDLPYRPTKLPPIVDNLRTQHSKLWRLWDQQQASNGVS